MVKKMEWSSKMILQNVLIIKSELHLRCASIWIFICNCFYATSSRSCNITVCISNIKSNNRHCGITSVLLQMVVRCVTLFFLLTFYLSDGVSHCQAILKPKAKSSKGIIAKVRELCMGCLTNYPMILKVGLMVNTVFPHGACRIIGK